MFSALNPLLTCGSSVTLCSLKKSLSVPEAAGRMVGATATGTAGAAALRPAAGTVPGAGCGGSGRVGSADAVVPANPTTPATPAATPPVTSPQRRAFANI